MYSKIYLLCRIVVRIWNCGCFYWVLMDFSIFLNIFPFSYLFVRRIYFMIWNYSGNKNKVWHKLNLVTFIPSKLLTTFRRHFVSFFSFTLYNLASCQVQPSGVLFPPCRAVGTGGRAPPQFLAGHLTLSQSGGQIMPTALLRATSSPDFQIFLRPWNGVLFPRVFLSILIIRPPFDSQLSLPITLPYYPIKVKGQNQKTNIWFWFCVLDPYLCTKQWHGNV